MRLSPLISLFIACSWRSSHNMSDTWDNYEYQGSDSTAVLQKSIALKNGVNTLSWPQQPRKRPNSVERRSDATAMRWISVLVFYVVLMNTVEAKCNSLLTCDISHWYIHLYIALLFLWTLNGTRCPSLNFSKLYFSVFKTVITACKKDYRLRI